MKKAIGMLALGMLFLIALTSFSSAYYYGGYYDPYYGGGNYDSYHSYTTRTKGSYYGPKITTTTNYDKVSARYWDGSSWVDKTTYSKVKRETPDCYYGGCGYYPGYRPNYYGAYYYPDYDNRYYDYNYPRTRYWY